jgi:hypothetical protein
MKALSVIVVPMETNLEPYQLELNIKGILFIHYYILINNASGNETSLKQVFDYNVNNYWTRVFKGHSPKEPPSYRY